MVLTEAFAAGTPVVASDIAGYRDVVAHGRDGLLVPRADATALAETLRDLANDPARVEALAAHAGESAERYTWPRIAAQVASAYEDAQVAPQPETASERAAIRIGLKPADGLERIPARRLPSLEPLPDRRRRGRFVRRGLLGGAGLATVVGSYLAVQHIGLERIGDSLVRSSPSWVLLGLALMCASMLLRAVSWHAILKAAMPDARPADGRRGAGHDDRRADVGDAARPAGRAVARARGGAPARPCARPPAGRPRHARVADADQRARARDPRRRDVHDDRALRRPSAGAAVVRPGAADPARARAGRARR